MARPLRLEFPGALYHVTARGNARNAIVLDDEDRAVFLACLGDIVLRFGCVCHAYCLMDNHYHLLIETRDGNVSRGMRQFNGVFTQRMNRRHNRVGHLFKGRFKVIIVERESYLLELCRYVVLNPIRAGMVTHLERYPWSSYPATRGLVACPGWFSPDWVLSQFGARRAAAQALRGICCRRREPLIPIVCGERPSPAGLGVFRGIHAPVARREARTAYLDYGYSMAAIANHADIHYSTVSKIVKGKVRSVVSRLDPVVTRRFPSRNLSPWNTSFRERIHAADSI